MGIGLGLQGVAIGCDLNVEVNGCGILVIVIGCGYRLYSGKRRAAPYHVQRQQQQHQQILA